MTSKQRRWKRISELYDKPYYQRTERELHLTMFGLCFAARALWCLSSYFALTYFLEGNHMPPYRGTSKKSLTRWTSASDTMRAQLAALFAVMTDKERREVFNGVKA